jgi:(+)-trans-carveol dehydrogenase
MERLHYVGSGRRESCSVALYKEAVDMGRLDGKVALISGAARGQGRAHAITLAGEGAQIVGFDICQPFQYPLHPAATSADLAETGRLVGALTPGHLFAEVDARELEALETLADDVMSRFGRLDILVVNHGIWSIAPNAWSLDERSWQETIDVNLTGAWKVTKAFIPRMIESGNGGAIVLTSSGSGVRAQPGAAHYSASKFGIIGLAKALAAELGEYEIRVNAILPGAVNTAMSQEGGTWSRASGYHPRYWESTGSKTLLRDSLQPPESIARAVLWLVSDDARFVTGASIPIDSGYTS